VAKTESHTGPVDVLEQAVVALVGCIEILADSVDVLQERLEMPARPQLAIAPEASSESADVRVELADLTRQVEDLTKTVKKLSSKSLESGHLERKKLGSKSIGSKNPNGKNPGKRKK
jgi:hypothetical protein